jgi:hypothetical protein
MTTIFERVEDALDLLSPPVPFGMKPYLSVSGELPTTFIDYQLIDSPPEQHAENVETERSYEIQVSIWSTDGLNSLPNVDGVMIAAGFKKSNVRQLPKDQETGHFGLAKDYVYLENQ